VLGLKSGPLGWRQMQTVLRSSIEDISGPRSPLRFAKIGHFTLIEISTEMTPEIRTTTGRTQ
jgi:hypothetical protein